MIYMSGLPFSPGSTYNTKLDSMNAAGIECVNLFTSTTVGVSFPATFTLVSLDKPWEDTNNITLELKNSAPSTSTTNLKDGYIEKTPNPLGH